MPPPFSRWRGKPSGAGSRSKSLSPATTAIPIDPAQLEPRALGELLEASDLSCHPGKALARLRDCPSGLRRDIVLLTHPRSLAEPEVVTAARSLAEDGGARLFAVSVDAKGQVEMAELRRGLPVVLTRGRIELAAPQSPATPVPDRSDRAIFMAWNGTFESIGFPFFTGALDQLETSCLTALSSYDFDDAGERILIVGRHGHLFSCRIDGSETETLPRPRAGNDLLTFRKHVVGVAGGFVLEGRCQKRRFLVHYDFPIRTCTLHEIHDLEVELTWLYYRDLNSIAGLPVNGDRSAAAVDLSEPGATAATSARAKRAAGRASAGPRRFPPPISSVWAFHGAPGRPELGLALARRGIRDVAVSAGARGEVSLTPTLDGKPAFKGGELIRVLHGGGVLAILVAKVAGPTLYFLTLSRAAVIGAFPLPGRPMGTPFSLSRDGRRFARPLDSQRLEVRDVPGDQPPLLVTSQEDVWIHFAALGRSCLLVREFDLRGPRRARFSWLIRWDQGWLNLTVREADSSLDLLGGVLAVSRSVSAGNLGLGYDSERFVQIIEHGGLRILIDRYNHLVILGGGGELVCVMFVSRDEFAGWLPDGTMFGPRRLIGGEPTRRASERIAAALLRAERGGGSSR